MSKKKQYIEEVDYTGVEMLRAAAWWSGNRPEYMNANKSAVQIINDYKKYLKEHA
jgi:hypothetical protein